MAKLSPESCGLHSQIELEGRVQSIYAKAPSQGIPYAQMNACIYCQESNPTVQFTSQEHVFPAGLGGTFQLPVGIVCDSCNKDNFSKLELDFIRNSFISLPRQFYGPGKRGSLSPQNASTSNVHIALNPATGDKALGFTKLGAPFNIAQIHLHSVDGGQIILDPKSGNADDQLAKFGQTLRNFSGKFVFIEDELLGEEDTFFGFHDDKYYLAAKSRDAITRVTAYLELLRKGEFIETTDRKQSAAQVQVRQHLQFKMDALHRTCGKIVFNALCYIKGDAFCRDDRFTPFRKWVRFGGENSFVSLVSEDKDPFKGPLQMAFPQLSHRLVLLSMPQFPLASVLNFYGHFSFQVRIATDGPSNELFSGIICDWQDNRDYIWHEYMSRFSGES